MKGGEGGLPSRSTDPDYGHVWNRSSEILGQTLKVGITINRMRPVWSSVVTGVTKNSPHT